MKSKVGYERLIKITLYLLIATCSLLIFIACENQIIIGLTDHMFCKDCERANVKCICSPGLSYKLGDIGPGGGIIFYVADGKEGRPFGFTVQMEPSSNNYTAHYLEAAPAGWYGTPVDPQINWATTGSTAATTFLGTAEGLGTGRRNTSIIIAEDGGASAARDCFNYGTAPYKDWFLPSYDEIVLLSQQQSIVGGIVDITGLNSYWTSTEPSDGVGATAARRLYVFDGSFVGHGSKGSANAYVRPIRAF